jgi:hypothetical protein
MNIGIHWLLLQNCIVQQLQVCFIQYTGMEGIAGFFNRKWTVEFVTKCKRSITARARATFFGAGVVDTTSSQKKEQVLDVDDVLRCSRILLSLPSTGS